MPIAAPETVGAMNTSVQNIAGNLPTSAEALAAWNAASAWAPVATSFFSSAVIPAVTDLGKAAGEAAFITAVGASSPAANQMTEGALSAGFQAYAAAVVAPTFCNPPLPVVHAPPASAPVLNLSGLAPSESTLPSTTVLYNQLKEWVVSGTQTTPGTPPVTVPWS